MYVRRVIASFSVGLVAVLAGCHAGAKAGATSSTGPPASASPSPSAADAAGTKAVAAYRGMWAAFVDAAKTSNPDAPDVRTYASDNALKLIVSSLYTSHAQGKVSKGQVVLNPKVTDVKPPEAPTEATIVDTTPQISQWFDPEPGVRFNDTW